MKSKTGLKIPPAEVVHLSKRVVDGLDSAREKLYQDDELRGFRLRVRSGRKVYMYRYGGGAQGVTRWITIGEHQRPWIPHPETGAPRVLTAEMARREAERLRGLVVARQDPALDRDTQRRVPTFAKFAARYLEEHGKAHKAKSTQKGDAWFLTNKLLPAFGAVRMDRIDRSAVTRWHVAQAGHEATANRCLGLLGAIFTAAIRWGVLAGPSPCALVQPFKTHRRERLLTREELQKIGAKLSEPGGDVGAAAVAGICLLMCTGARREEISSLTWEQIDTAPEVVMVRPDGTTVTGRAVMQAGKTGRRRIIFGPSALAVLAKLPRLNEWVLPGRYGRGPMHPATLSHAWKRSCDAAGVTDAHLHDIRHLFISTAVEHGKSLPHAGQLAGQATLSMTESYAHLTSGPLLELAERTAAAIRLALDAPAPEEKVG